MVRRWQVGSDLLARTLTIQPPLAAQGEDCSNPAGDLLQAPEYYIQQQSHIPNMQRRTFAGMVGHIARLGRPPCRVTLRSSRPH